MNEEPVHRIFRTPVSEWVASVPSELEDDAVGLWQIIPVGRVDFGLEGNELVNYVRKALLAVFAQGAKPVEGATDGKHYWKLRENYGDEPERMAEAIIDEWLASGHDPDPGGIWFALPKVYNMTH
jgi:hypothetical protein